MNISHQYTSPNHWVANNEIKAIVLHGTAGGFKGSVDWLCNPAHDVSANYLIDKDGTVYCLVDPYKGLRAWANGPVNKPDAKLIWLADASKNGVNPNLLTISIEHVATAAEMKAGTPMPLAQQAASLSLCDQLLRDFNLPRTEQTVVGHSQIDKVNKADCPGVINIVEWIQKLIAMDSIQLDNYVITGDFKNYYLNTKSGSVQEGIHLFGRPLSNKFVGSDGVTRQIFERTVLGINPTAPKEWRVVGELIGSLWLKENTALINGH